MSFNYDVPLNKEVFLELKSNRLKVIEKSVLRRKNGESVLGYKCQLNDKKEWIHHTVIEAFFNIIGDYDGSKTNKKTIKLN